MFLSTSLPSAPSWRSLTWAVKLPWSAWCRRGGEEAGLVNSSPRRMKCWVCTPEQGQHALEGFPSTDKAIVGKGVFPLFTRMVVKSPFYAGWIRCCLQRCLVAASWETGQWKDAKLNSPSCFAGSLWMPRNICLCPEKLQQIPFQADCSAVCCERDLLGGELSVMDEQSRAAFGLQQSATIKLRNLFCLKVLYC